MRKRSIAVVLALLMVCGLVLPVMAAASLKPFADVPEHHWAYESVLQLQAAGLVEGYPDGEYKGQRPMTRYELAMVIARFLAQLDSRIADQLEALRPGMVEEVSAEVSDLIKDEFAKAMAAIDAAKAEASAEAKDELEKAKLELAKALEAVEGKPAVETKVVERPFEMTPEVLSLIQEEVAKAVAGLEPAVSQDDLAAVLAEAKAAKADAAKAQAAADAAAADAAKSLEEVAALKKAAQDAADEAKVAHELALKALAEAAALDDRITSQDLAIAALSDEVKSNKQAMEALIDAKSQVLADSIGDLAAEFEEELAILGVRVTELENLFAVLEDRVADLEVAQAETAAAVDAHLDDHTRMVKLSGKTEVKFEETVLEDQDDKLIEAKGFPAYEDLMDRDPEELYEEERKFEQVYELNLGVKPTPGIEVMAGLEGTNVFGIDEEEKDQIKLDSLYLELTTEGVLKRLRFGTMPELNWSDFTLQKYSDAEDKEEDRPEGMYAFFGFPSNVSMEAVFERLEGKDVMKPTDIAVGGENITVPVNNWTLEDDGGEDVLDRANWYFGALRTQWAVNENLKVGAAVLGEVESVTNKKHWEDGERVLAFNTEVNLGNLDIAGEYAIASDGNAYQIGAGADLGVLKVNASVLDIEEDFLALREYKEKESETLKGFVKWGYGRGFDEDKDKQPDNIEFARGLRKIDVGAEVPVGSLTLGAGYSLKEVPEINAVGRKYGYATEVELSGPPIGWGYIEAPWGLPETTYDKRTVSAEMPIGPAKLVLAGGMGERTQGSDTLDVKYGKVGVEDIPVVSGMTLDLTATALRNTTDWAKERKWADENESNKFKAAMDYDVTENMNLYGSFEVKDDLLMDKDDDGKEKYTKTVEAGADYRLDLGAVEVTPSFALKKVLDSSTDQMIAYGVGAKTTIFGAGIDASYLRRVGKGGRDEEYDSEDTIWDLNLGYPIAEGVEFKLGGKYIDHDRKTWEWYDTGENKWKWSDAEGVTAPADSNPSFVVKQVTAGISVAF
ncbi:MAG: S-layer homology domain-containing protein [Limnochordia bacterium]|jgi:hypothetical protein